MAKNSNRRSKLLIDTEVQSRIIFNMMWPPAVALAVTALVLGFLCRNLLNEALEARVDLPSLLPILVTVMVFLLVSLTYLVFNALKFSHRVAGPMYRVQKTLTMVQEGDMSVRANLRDGDFLGEVADGVNDFLNWIESHPDAVAALGCESRLEEDGVEGEVADDETVSVSESVSVDSVPSLATGLEAETAGDLDSAQAVAAAPAARSGVRDGSGATKHES